MATAIPQAWLASSAIRCRDVETGPNLGVLAVLPSNGATGEVRLATPGFGGGGVFEGVQQPVCMTGVGRAS